MRLWTQFIVAGQIDTERACLSLWASPCYRIGISGGGINETVVFNPPQVDTLAISPDTGRP